MDDIAQQHPDHIWPQNFLWSGEPTLPDLLAEIDKAEADGGVVVFWAVGDNWFILHTKIR